MAEKKKQPTFEQALARLEEIVQAMDSGNLDLDKMMAHFEEGTGLVKVCNEKLNEVEQKIELLVRKGEQVDVRPLDETDGS
jgi:exodeoxyribonuclease VII small subunit